MEAAGPLLLVLAALLGGVLLAVVADGGGLSPLLASSRTSCLVSPACVQMHMRDMTRAQMHKRNMLGVACMQVAESACNEQAAHAFGGVVHGG